MNFLYSLTLKANKIQGESSRHVKEIFARVYTGMNGNFTRFKIIMALKDESLNTNQLSEKLQHDYKTIQRNLKILEDNGLVCRVGSGYGDIFFLTEFTIINMNFLYNWIERIRQKIENKNNLKRI